VVLMENGNVVKHNMGKGILFALIGGVVGAAVWLAVIAFFGRGTGGAIGGAFAGVLGVFVGGGYKKGLGKPGIIGYIIVAVIAFVVAAGAIVLGVTIYLYNEGVADSLGDTFERMMDYRPLRAALIQDLLFMSGIAIGGSIMGIAEGKEDKKKD